LNGKRYVKRIGKSKQIAELALKDIEVKIAKSRAGFAIQHRIDEWLPKFYAYIKAHLREATVKSYTKSLTYFTEFLNSLPDPPVYLSEITPSILEEFKLHRLRQGKKKKTVNNDLFQKVEMLKLTDRKIPRFLTKEELQKIYSQLRDEDRDIVQVLANTGMRWGELRHLEWSDIDLEKRVIKIRKKVLHTGRQWLPKTGQDRDIPMNDTVYDIISKRKKVRDSCSPQTRGTCST